MLDYPECGLCKALVTQVPGIYGHLGSEETRVRDGIQNEFFQLWHQLREVWEQIGIFLDQVTGTPYHLPECLLVETMHATSLFNPFQTPSRSNVKRHHVIIPARDTWHTCTAARLVSAERSRSPQ